MPEREPLDQYGLRRAHHDLWDDILDAMYESEDYRDSDHTEAADLVLGVLERRGLLPTGTEPDPMRDVATLALELAEETMAYLPENCEYRSYFYNELDILRGRLDAKEKSAGTQALRPTKADD